MSVRRGQWPSYAALQGGAVTLDAEHHRRHVVVELAIRDLKGSLGLEHRPTGDFNANAAWALVTSINLVRWVGALGLELNGPLVAKTICHKFIALPDRLNHSAQRRRLHFEVARVIPGDFQREEFTNFLDVVTRHTSECQAISETATQSRLGGSFR